MFLEESVTFKEDSSLFHLVLSLGCMYNSLFHFQNGIELLVLSCGSFLCVVVIVSVAIFFVTLHKFYSWNIVTYAAILADYLFVHDFSLDIVGSSYITKMVLK